MWHLCLILLIHMVHTSKIRQELVYVSLILNKYRPTSQRQQFFSTVMIERKTYILYVIAWRGCIVFLSNVGLVSTTSIEDDPAFFCQLPSPAEATQQSIKRMRGLHYFSTQPLSPKSVALTPKPVQSYWTCNCSKTDCKYTAGDIRLQLTTYRV